MANSDRATEIARHLPFLRRYARALTGNQKSGDAYAAATLEAIIEAPDLLTDLSRVALFSVFHGIWKSAGAPVASDEDGHMARAQDTLSGLTENTREALLLHTVEEFDYDEVGRIMQIDADEARALVTIARREMANTIRGEVLIIEDEPIIAMDIENIVSDAGHRVFGVARTHKEAVEIGSGGRPSLILADIHLADDSSGIDAVNELLALHGDVPVIFITAFPERLLTGDRPEPAFLITKPFREEQVLSAISQAMFFASTATLKS